MGDRQPAEVRFGILGQLVAIRDGAELCLGPTQQRLVLAVLLLHANQRTSREQIIDAVWGDAPPAYSVNLVQKHISALRRLIDPDRPRGSMLTWTEAGYQLVVTPDCLDLDEFEQAVGRAREACRAGELRQASRDLKLAAALWRGPVLDGLSSPFVDAVRERLTEQRVGVLEDLIDVRTSLGESVLLIPELRKLVAQYPLRERLHGLLMMALYRSGRQADALQVFRRARRLLRDELGVEPGPALVRLHQRILVADPELGEQDVEPARPHHAGRRPDSEAWLASSPTPAQLPAAPPDFTGREAELALLNALLDRPASSGQATTIITIAGTAGVGKSALAVHWAHQARQRFPDAQLYVNLRGFEHGDTARSSAMKPAEAVRSFLDGFGVPRHRIPVGLESQAALYRSLVADRRVLILLDNARDTDQVRPLLPGGSACLAVVTSRNELPGLIAVDGAQPISLDLLTVPESRELLARRLGAARTAADPRSIDMIIASCARLPLALTIAAARAAARPHFPLGVLAEELRGIRGRLDAFDGGDRATDIRAVFSWSYQALSPASAQLFRLLGMHPGPDATAPATSSLSGSPIAMVRRCLIELARANLVTERAPGRFEFHDLLRSYACELADQLDPPELCRAATGRLLDHYLQTAARAHHLLNPHHDDPITLPPVTDGVEIGEIADHDHALSWFAAERAVLLAALRRAGDAGLDQQAWQLAWAITPFLEYEGYWHEWRAALEACRQYGDLRCRALTTRLLGRALVRLGRFDDAHEQLQRALSLYREINDSVGRGHTHRDIAWKLDGQGGYAREALEHVERAYELFREAGHRSGEGRTLNGIGWFHIVLGDYEFARIRCMEALTLQREIGDRFGQAETWDSLGYLNLHLAEYEQAVSCYEQAVELYGEFHDQYNMADSMSYLGDVYRAAGNIDATRKAWTAALPILDRLGHPDADRLRGKLRALDEVDTAETALVTAH